MVETREVEINGKRFAISQLTATRSLMLLRRLAATGIPTLMQAAPAMKDGLSTDIAALDAGALGAAASLLFEKLTEAELSGIMDTLLSAVRYVEGDKGIQMSAKQADLVFGGDIGSLVSLLGHCLEVNYRDFLGGPLAALRAMVTRNRSKESSTLSGLSGVSSSSSAQP